MAQTGRYVQGYTLVKGNPEMLEVGDVLRSKSRKLWRVVEVDAVPENSKWHEDVKWIACIEPVHGVVFPNGKRVRSWIPARMS